MCQLSRAATYPQVTAAQPPMQCTPASACLVTAPSQCSPLCAQAVAPDPHRPSHRQHAAGRLHVQPVRALPAIVNPSVECSCFTNPTPCKCAILSSENESSDAHPAYPCLLSHARIMVTDIEHKCRHCVTRPSNTPPAQFPAHTAAQLALPDTTGQLFLPLTEVAAHRRQKLAGSMAVSVNKMGGGKRIGQARDE